MSIRDFINVKPFCSRWRVYVAVFVTALIAEIFLLNTVPLVTGEIGTLFVPRHIPEDYFVLKDFILKQPEYFRTLWVPTDSRWGIYTNQHPKVSLVSIIGDKWKPFLDETQFGNSPSEQRNRIVDSLKRSFSNDLLDSSSIKYVIVPLQDRANDDDFFVHYGMSPSFYIQTLDALPYLKRIDIGTKEVVIYVNEGYRDHVYAEHEVWSLESFNRLDEKMHFLTEVIGSKFQFTVSGSQPLAPAIPISRLTSLFERVTPESISANSLNQSILAREGSRVLFEETSRLNLFATTTADTLSLVSQPESSLKVNDIQQPSAQGEVSLASIDLKSDRQYFVGIGSALTPILKTATSQYLGSVPPTISAFEVFSTDNVNHVPNGSFEERLWQEKVGDCNAYDDKGILDMFRSLDSASEGGASMQLEAVTHIACASTTFGIGEGEYVFSFDHQSPNAKQAGYFVQFQSNAGATTYSERISTQSTWQTFSRNVTAPNGTTSVSIFLYAYSMEGVERIVNRYDGVKLIALTREQDVAIEHTSRYASLPLPELANRELKFQHTDPRQSLSNLIPNSSFDDGLWSQTVGDCNAYDSQPKLGMFIRNNQDDNYLELSATRHIACTGPGQIPVRELREYLLSFKYKSPNATEAGFYIGFNDLKGSKISQRLPIQSADWQLFSRSITIPESATNASLLVYAYSKDEQTKIINHYDDFVLIELPEVRDRYYFVERPARPTQSSPTVSWNFINPTKKIVNVSEAHGTFFLLMSESYHPSWHAFVRQKGSRDLRWWETLLFRKPGIKIPDSQHIVANGFANGWWISEADVRKGTGDRVDKKISWFDIVLGNRDPASSAFPASSVSSVSSGVSPNSQKPSESSIVNGDGLSRQDQHRSLPTEYEIVLEFWPQRYFYLGLLISGTTLLCCIGYLIFDWRRRRRASKKLYSHQQPRSSM